jgi:prepilin peptidase CpaA
LSLWPEVAAQVGVALAAFVVLAGLFALRAMGGGDVKLLTALALWIEPASFLKLIVIMALLGGVLTILFAGWHMIRRRKDRLTIPYGVAIASAGLWVLSTQYWPAAGFATGNAG